MNTTHAPATTLQSTRQAPVTTATTYDIDPSHTSAAFKVRHLMVSRVRGELGPVSGTVVIDQQDVTRSKVDVVIDASAINTREPKRDEHLRSADFLDVANHPNITFRSTAVRAGKGGDLAVTGDLTIRGVSHPVVLTVEALPPAIKDPWGNGKRGATARTSFSRKEWGLTWNLALEAGGVVVSDQVDVEIEVELLERKA